MRVSTESMFEERLCPQGIAPSRNPWQKPMAHSIAFTWFAGCFLSEVRNNDWGGCVCLKTWSWSLALHVPLSFIASLSLCSLRGPGGSWIQHLLIVQSLFLGFANEGTLSQPRLGQKATRHCCEWMWFSELRQDEVNPEKRTNPGVHRAEEPVPWRALGGPVLGLVMQDHKSPHGLSHPELGLWFLAAISILTNAASPTPLCF